MSNKKTPLTSGVAGVGNGPESSGYNLSAHLLRTIFGTGIGAIFDHKPGREHAVGLAAKWLPSLGNALWLMIWSSWLLNVFL